MHVPHVSCTVSESKRDLSRHFKAGRVEACTLCLRINPCDCSQVKALPVSRRALGLRFRGNLHVGEPCLYSMGHSTLLTRRPEKQREEDRGG